MDAGSLLKNTWLSWLLIAVITILVYMGTFRYGILYNYDDDAYFQDKSIRELSMASTRNYFSGYYLGMYQPVPVLSYAVIQQLFPESVTAQRLVNFILHCLNALLVLILVSRITGNKMAGWLTALVFAVHPMHVESVTWIATRGNLTYSVFYLLTLICFYDWLQKPLNRKLILVSVFFLLALFSKVTAATLPLVMLLLAWYNGQKFNWKTVLFYLPFFVVAGIFVWVGTQASGSFGHITELKSQYSFIDRVFLILNALWLYMVKAFVPYSQSVIYLYPWKTGGMLPLSYYITGGIILVVISALFVAGWKNRKQESGKILLFGLLFFLLTISIVLPLKWSRTILIAERYTYLPYIGLFTAVFVMGISLYRKTGLAVRRILAVLLVALITVYGWLALERNKVWENPKTLFGDVITGNRTTAEIAMGYYNRGNEYLRLGEMEWAEEDYSAALQRQPSYVEALYNRGLVYMLTNRFEQAVEDLSSSIRLDDRNPDAFVNRGIAYRSIGKFDLALNDFNTVISRSESAIAYYNRGTLYYFNYQDTVQGCSDWQTASRLGFGAADELLRQFCK